jgi:hypothetical protein
MDGTQLFTYFAFILTTLVSLKTIPGEPTSPYWLAASAILGIVAVTDFYLNQAEGFLLPTSLLDPNYKVNKVKGFLNLKEKEPLDETVSKNGKELKRSHYTRLDYLSEKLHLSTDERITGHFALFPTPTAKGLAWLRFYYAYSSSEYGPGLHDKIPDNQSPGYGKST